MSESLSSCSGVPSARWQASRRRSRAAASRGSPTGAPTSPAGARPGRRAQGRAHSTTRAAHPPRSYRRPHLPEAVDADADQLRGRDRRARRNGALRALGRPAARTRRVDAGHRDRPLALPERDPHPHVRPGEVDAFAEHATIPIVNGFTDAAHPLQALADAMTIRELAGSPVSGSRTSVTGTTSATR